MLIWEPSEFAENAGISMRKPFDVLAEGLISENSRGKRI
jgi:hypothetical protein